MLSLGFLTIVFAAAFTIELPLIFAGFRWADHRAARARMSLAVPALLSNDDGAQDAQGRRDTSFLRYPANKLHEREMREVVSAFMRLRITPRRARFALTISELASAAVLAALALLVTQRLFHSGGPVWIGFPLALIGAGAGWSLPMLLAHRAADHRAAAVARGLPEALELLVVCVEAGLSLENGLLRITEALRATEPLLAEELALTAADLRVLANLDQGLLNLAARVDLPDVRSVVMILSQSLRYGTPLAESLRSAAATMRNEALIKLEERGNRLPTLLTLPMMLLIFPTIFLIVIGPAALNALDAFKH
jgi:tight adherence protein C